jgi:hypothetical protein
MDQQVPNGTFTISNAIEAFIVLMGDLHPHSDIPISPLKQQIEEISVPI